MATCSACGAVNQVGEKFCAECGMKLPSGPAEQIQAHSAVDGRADVTMSSEQFEAYRAEFEKVAVDGSVNLLARRKLKSVRKLLNLSDEQAKAFEERIQAEWKQRQAEVVARKAEEERVRMEELDKKRREEAARQAEEARIRQDEHERKRLEDEEAERAREAEESREEEEARKKEEQELLEWYEKRCANEGKWQAPEGALVILSPIALLVGILFLCFGWTILGLIGMGAAGIAIGMAFDGKCPSWFDNSWAGYLILLAFVGCATLFHGGRWFFGLMFLLAGCFFVYALLDFHADEQKKIERAKALKEKQQECM